MGPSRSTAHRIAHVLMVSIFLAYTDPQSTEHGSPVHCGQFRLVCKEHIRGRYSIRDVMEFWSFGGTRSARLFWHCAGARRLAYFLKLSLHGCISFIFLEKKKGGNGGIKYIYTPPSRLCAGKMGRGGPGISRNDIRMIFPENDPPPMTRYDIMSNIKILPSTAEST